MKRSITPSYRRSAPGSSQRRLGAEVNPDVVGGIPSRKHTVEAVAKDRPVHAGRWRQQQHEQAPPHPNVAARFVDEEIRRPEQRLAQE
jgi:hypothetical protein